MKKNLFLTPLLCFALLSCVTTPKETDEDKKPMLDSLLHAYYQERFQLFPFEATTVGDDRYNDLWPNAITKDYRDKTRKFFSKYRSKLLSYDKSALSEDDQTNYDVLLWECDITLEGDQFKDYLMPISQMFNMMPTLAIILEADGKNIQPFKTVKDYDNWLARLDGYLSFCDSAIVNMKKGIDEGYVLPTAITSKVIPQFAAFDHGPVKDHFFYGPINSLPTEFSQKDKNRLTKAYSDIIENRVIPTHRKLTDFLKTEYLSKSRSTVGIDAVPKGKEYYSHLLKKYTTTAITADQVFALGKTEVERITKEMESVKQNVGYKGDLKSFFEYLRHKKELTPFTKPEEVIANFNAIHERMKPNLDNLFEKKPKGDFEVRRTQAFRESTAAAEYVTGSQDGTRPGIFYVPIPDVKTYNVLSDEDLFLHEAIPGHHYETAMQMENMSLPEFRRILVYSAYAEGWGLYAESLGSELGLYKDPYQYFGMLSAEMHRAIRLVVDAGIHSQGWTREHAIQYSLDHEARTKEGIIAEIERYTAMPGQAVSYKVGQLKIKELRTKAEKELGNKFAIAKFHTQILNSGSIPLDVMEKKINKWIEEVKKVE